MFRKRQDGIIAEIREVRNEILNQLAALEKRIMSGVDDLKVSIGKIATDLTAEQDVINQVIQKLQGGGLTDADAETLAQQLQGSATSIEAITSSLQNALNPPAAQG